MNVEKSSNNERETTKNNIDGENMEDHTSTQQRKESEGVVKIHEEGSTNRVVEDNEDREKMYVRESFDTGIPHDPINNSDEVNSDKVNSDEANSSDNLREETGEQEQASWKKPNQTSQNRNSNNREGEDRTEALPDLNKEPQGSI
ncbi:hypothetical protein L1887_25554 [Cichorium endivia]|nr:hypothetical protein L1887_25554 [Cichorium endivia]